MPTLNEIIDAWRNHYGKKKYPSCKTRFILFEERPRVLGHLIKTLKEVYGYNADNFTEEVREKIISNCVSEVVQQKTLDRWRNYVKRDLLDALDRHYPNEIFAKELAKLVPMEPIKTKPEIIFLEEPSEPVVVSSRGHGQEQ